jgi:beta-barrel assembly-enhancing protease
MKPITMSRLIFSLFLAVGLVATQANALDFNKVLKDAVKDKIEEVKNGGDAAPASTPATPPTAQPAAVPEAAPSTPPAATTNPAAPPVAVAPAETKSINWKNPSQEEEIALGRNITGSLLGAAPLVKDEALQLYGTKWVVGLPANQNAPIYRGNLA